MSLEPLVHRGMNCIAVKGRLNATISKMIREYPGRLFSKTHSCWYVLYSESELSTLAKRIASVQEIQVGDFGVFGLEHRKSVEEVKLPEGYHEQLIRVRYSEATVKTYESQMRAFLVYIHPLPADRITEAVILKYLEYLVVERRVSVSTQNTAINAIKFYLEHVLRSDRRTYFIDRPIKEHKLPRVLSEEEVKRMIEVTVNAKHRCMLLLMYSAGLRMSELLNLKWSDFDVIRMQLFVSGGKGKKDRVTLLSGQVINFVKHYMSLYNPKQYLFEGPLSARYSPRSVNMIVKKAARNANVLKRISAHTLRHSFATHLLEHGTDIRYIQALMGHESGKTTERYTHVTTRGFSKIVSPLDRLGLNLSGEALLDVE